MIAKDLHVFFVILTGAFFFIRGIWMLTDSNLQNKRWVRILAPVIDTLLLVSAIYQSIQISQYPLTHGWLTAKVTALLFYIALGMIALTYGRTKNIRTVAWLGALCCFGYIVSVALTRNPLIIF